MNGRSPRRDGIETPIGRVVYGQLIYTRVKPDELEYSQKLYSLRLKTYTSKPSISARKVSEFLMSQ
jgi:hypothetical protein